MSTSLPIYVLDANVFMQAHRRHYAFDICPGFWDSLLYFHQAGRIISLDRVKAEIDDGDALAGWVKKTAPTSLFAPTADSAVVGHFTSMMKWVQDEPQYRPDAKSQFARAADGAGWQPMRRLITIMSWSHTRNMHLMRRKRYHSRMFAGNLKSLIPIPS